VGGLGVFGSGYFSGTITGTNVVVSGSTNVTNSTQSGALQVVGGAGIGGSVVIGGTVTSTNAVVTGSTNATTTNSGALQVVGGVGVGNSIYAGGSVTANSGIYSIGAFTGSYSDGIVVDYATGNGRISVGGSDNLTFYSGGPATTATMVLNATGVVSIPSTLVTNSTNSGALQVSGGVGINGSVYVGGVVTATTFYGNLSGTASNATNAASATTATNLAGGATGSIPYQTAAGLTAFIPISPNNGYVLMSNGTTATWQNPASGTVNNAVTATNINGWLANEILFQYSPGITTASTGLTFNPATSILTAANLTVSGVTTSTGILYVTSSQASSNVSSGAVQVTGGVGIGGALNVGGIITGGLSQTQTNSAVTILQGGNTTVAAFTSNSTSTSAQVQLDTWATASFRTARYLCQVVDGTKVHISEITLFHDGTNVYKNEYGISTNTGELGTFDADYHVSNASNVTLLFTPNYTPTSMVIKVSRLGIAL
jgi:hypothetical protein